MSNVYSVCVIRTYGRPSRELVSGRPTQGLAGDHPEDLAYEHSSAQVFSDALLSYDLYGPEAAAYMDSIGEHLEAAGVDSSEAEKFVTTLANA